MKLDKEIRSRLHVARQAITFRWPSTAVEPTKGNTYAVESEAGATGFHILVTAAEELTGGGWQVAAKLAQDPVRLLAKGNGYTDFEGRALRSGTEPEPEAVDEDVQHDITTEARRQAGARDHDLVASLDNVLSLLRGEVEKHPSARLIKSELWQARGRLEAARRKVAHRYEARYDTEAA